MKIGSFLQDLRKLDIELRLDDGDSLVCDAPKGAMTSEISETIRRHKAEIIDFLRPKKRDKWSTLVPIQPAGDSTPFFCFHGVGGNVLNYSHLSKYLGNDQPLYGLQSVGLDGITPPLQDIPSMAALYRSEIETLQPHGPYYLGGGSMGGLLAIEVAQQFRKEGQEIDLLILFDTIGPNLPVECQPHRSPLNKLVSQLSKKGPISALPYLRSSAKNRWTFHRRVAKCRNHLRKGNPIPLEYRFWYVEQVNLKAISTYDCQYYKGELVLIRGDLIEGRGPLFDPMRGWSGMSDELQIHPIPGQHETLVEQPELGKILFQCLHEAKR